MKRPLQAILVGMFTAGVGLSMVITPLLLTHVEWYKYIIAFGLVFALLGATITFNATIDALRKR